MSYGNGNVRRLPQRSLLPLILVALATLFTLVASSAVFTVTEVQQAIITEFGAVVGQPIKEPGIHFKLPMVQEVHFIEKRIIEWDGHPNQIPTRDKKYISVDTTARWRIVDPLRYLESVATESSAQGRLDDIVDSATRDIVSDHNLVEIVRDTNLILDTETSTSAELEDDPNSVSKVDRIQVGRTKLQLAIATRAREVAPQYGIEIVDVLVKRINYEASVQAKVFERMISERMKIAERIRSVGRGQRAEIAGKRERELRKVRSEAFRKAETIKGAADAKATAIYAKSYAKAEGFYSFVKSLETYENALPAESVLVLSTDNDLLQHFARAAP